MISVDHVITVSLVLACSAISASFRIRRSGLAGYDDPYGLTNAFSDMDRPRRADYRTLLRQQVLEDEEPYFNPNSIPDDYNRNSPYDDSNENYGYIPEYMFEKSFQSYTPMDEYPLPYSGLEEREFMPQKRTTFVRSVPTVDELRTLFGEADVPMKRLPPVKRQEPHKRVQLEDNNSDDVPKITDGDSKADAVRKLIVAAEKLSINGKPVEQKAEEEIVKEGDDGKLLDIFKEASVDENGEVHENESEQELDDGDNVVLETSDMNDFIDESPAQSKSKRASNNVLSSEYVQNLLNEISALKQKVSKLEVLHLLEGKENDYLANALYFATLDQMEDKDVFIAKEYNDISKATDTEALIQELTGGEGDLVVDDDEDAAEEELLQEIEDVRPSFQNEYGEIAEKRSPEMSELSGQWMDTPVRENVGAGALLEDDDDDIDDSPIDIPYLEDELEDDDNDEEADEEEAAEEAKMESEAEENHILAELLGSLSPDTVENIIADLQAKSGDSLEGHEVCKPVLDLSKHCAFADEAGIPIDEDARNLCVRHQICYACGSGTGIGRSSCDEGYKGTVVAACEGDSSCLKDAAIFLKLMTHFHDYEQYSPLECKNPCVQDFIYGVD